MNVGVRRATPADRPDLRQAVIVLQDHERRLHDTRRPGEEIADAYLDWMLARAEADGAVLVADIDGAFAGFVAGWVAQDDAIAETAESNRHGLISDICVLPAWRGQGLSRRLLNAMCERLGAEGVSRIRITALAANRAARASYARAGFAEYEIVHERTLRR